MRFPFRSGSVEDARERARQLEDQRAELMAPEHLHRFGYLEMECRHEHLYDSQKRGREQDHKIKTTRVVETIWYEGFTAGVAHALATMSTRYIIVTAEEKAAMIEKMGESA